VVKVEWGAVKMSSGPHIELFVTNFSGTKFSKLPECIVLNIGLVLNLKSFLLARQPTNIHYDW